MSVHMENRGKTALGWYTNILSRSTLGESSLGCMWGMEKERGGRGEGGRNANGPCYISRYQEDCWNRGCTTTDRVGARGERQLWRVKQFS